MLERTALSVAYRGLEEDTDAVFEALDALAPETVVSVDLSGNKFSASAASKLAAKLFADMPNLTDLDMKDNRVGASGWAEIRVALEKHCPALTSLDLSENILRDDGVYDVALLLASRVKVRHLMLVTNHITTRGVPTLCDGLRQSKHLVELMVDYNMLGDDGANQLCTCIAGHPTLARLGMSDNGIGDCGAAAVAQHILGNASSRIEWLNLSVNRIGDAGFVAMCTALAGGEGSRAIRHIDFGCNPIQHEGRRTLCALVGQMKGLLSLDVCSLELSDSDIGTLVASLKRPSCNVTSMEWFNNPLLTLGAEKLLHDALEENYYRAEKREAAQATQRRQLLFAATAAVAVLLVLAIRNQKRVDTKVLSDGGPDTLLVSGLGDLAVTNKVLRPAKDFVTSFVKWLGA